MAPRPPHCAKRIMRPNERRSAPQPGAAQFKGRGSFTARTHDGSARSARAEYRAAAARPMPKETAGRFSKHPATTSTGVAPRHRSAGENGLVCMPARAACDLRLAYGCSLGRARVPGAKKAFKAKPVRDRRGSPVRLRPLLVKKPWDISATFGEKPPLATPDVNGKAIAVRPSGRSRSGASAAAFKPKASQGPAAKERLDRQLIQIETSGEAEKEKRMRSTCER